MARPVARGDRQRVLEQQRRLLADLLRRIDQRVGPARRKGLNLALRTFLQIEHHREGLRHRSTGHEQTVAAQDHRLVVAQVVDQACALVEVERRALIVVIGNPVVEAHRVLGDEQEPALHRRQRHAGIRMGVHDARDLGPRAVHGAVDREPGGVDLVGAVVVDLVAVGIDLDQARRRDLVEHQPVRVEQEGLLAGHARRDVGARHVGHGVEVGQAIAGREVDPHRPLLGGHLLLDARVELDNFRVRHVSSLLIAQSLNRRQSPVNRPARRQHCCAGRPAPRPRPRPRRRPSDRRRGRGRRPRACRSTARRRAPA